MDDRATTSRVSVLSYGLMVLGLAVLLVSTGPGADDRQGAVESSWIRAAAADDDPPPSGKDGQETDEPILGKDFPFEGPSERWPPRDRTPFPGRYADARHQAGNSRQADEAVGRALRWLAAHQSPDGRWEAGGFHHWCDGKPSRDEQPIDGQGKPLYDVGVTGLALAAYLGAGYTNRGDHDFAKTVGRGLKYLKDVQDPEGCFGPRSTQQYAYNHAAASLAMVEAYGMTGSPIFKGTAQRAVTFITQARNPYFAWRYGIKPGDNDTSITGWMGSVAMSARTINAAAIESGKPAPLVFEDTPIVDGIRNWLDKATDMETGRVGYLQRGTGPARPAGLVDRFPPERSESMTAVGVLLRIYGREHPAKSEIIQKGVKLCLDHLPVWNVIDGSIDMAYWHFATEALHQVGGEAWATWNDALQKALVDTQRRDTDACRFLGSWDPVGPWGPDGGRVYSTAMMALCLEAPYRYERVWAGD